MLVVKDTTVSLSLCLFCSYGEISSLELTKHKYHLYSSFKDVNDVL